MDEQALAVVEHQAGIVNVEEHAMSVAGLLKQVGLIQEVMAKVMNDGEHYGTIPGTQKPTLYKPGAEKLCLTFRLDPDYEVIREVRDKDFIAYTVKCTLTHIPSGTSIASGIGSCNSRETKYRFRYEEESTGEAVPKKYWDARTEGNNKEMKRLLGGDGFRAAKIDGMWVIAKSTKIENDNPWDLDNTLIKMACKRALVAATLNATAASDIFTQDIEDMPQETLPSEANPTKKKEPQQKEFRGGASSGKPMTDKQRKMIWAKMMEMEMGSGEAKQFFEDTLGKKPTTKEASTFIENFDTEFAKWTGANG